MAFTKNKRPEGWTLEDAFFAYVQSQRIQTLESGQLLQPLNLNSNQERKLLSALSKRKLIARVRRGLYLIPPTLPVGGIWTPSESLALATLMDDQDGTFQISGLNAFRRYGWDDQIPNRTFVYNDKISAARTIGSNIFDLTKVSKTRLGSVEKVTSQGFTLFYSSKPRSLIDAIYDWKRFNSLPVAFDWIRNEMKSGMDPSALVENAIEFGNNSTIRRLGVTLEACDAPRRLLNKLEKQVPRSSSNIPLSPSKPKRGQLNKRWGVVENYG